MRYPNLKAIMVVISFILICFAFKYDSLLLGLFAWLIAVQDTEL